MHKQHLMILTCRHGALVWQPYIFVWNIISVFTTRSIGLLLLKLTGPAECCFSNRSRFYLLLMHFVFWKHGSLPVFLFPESRDLMCSLQCINIKTVGFLCHLFQSCRQRKPSKDSTMSTGLLRNHRLISDLNRYPCINLIYCGNSLLVGLNGFPNLSLLGM